MTLGKDLEPGATIHWTMSPPLWRAAVQDFLEGNRSFITPRPFQGFVVWKINRNFPRKLFFYFVTKQIEFSSIIKFCGVYTTSPEGIRFKKKGALRSCYCSVLAPQYCQQSEPWSNQLCMTQNRDITEISLLPKGVSNQNNFNNKNRYILNRGNQSLHRKFGHQRIKGKPIPSEKIKLAVV